jgi:molecular chaperone Hsp33
MASWQGEVPDGNLASRFGSGQLAITIDPGTGGKRYQGIVALDGNSLADAIDDYLERSEQLPTRMWLGVADGQAAGLLLQRLPGSGNDEDWRRLSMLAGTVSNEELLHLPGEQLLHRLFHEEDRRQFAAQPVDFSCHCSRERLANALRSLGQEEVRSIIEEQGHIEATCQFCNQRYEFDVVDAEQIFAADLPVQGSDQLH